MLSECISLLHKSFNPIKKRKRAILCPFPLLLLLLLLHPGCHLFLIISFRIGEQITRSFIPLKSDLGREKAQCRKMTCQSADFELSVQICCPFEEKTAFSYYSPPLYFGSCLFLTQICSHLGSRFPRQCERSQQLFALYGNRY